MSHETMKETFDELLSKDIIKYNSARMSSAKYNELFNEVKTAKHRIPKQNRDYWLLRHYDVLFADGKEHLIAPVVNDVFLYYVIYEEVFDILYDIHQSIGHGGRDRMRKVVHKKYKNITVRQIQLFLNLCEPCLQKRKSEKKDLVVEPMRFEELNRQCQVNLIDYQSQADGDFKFILVYQDHLTKFVILKALRSKKADEIAHHILDIFQLFGAPLVLQSDNGKEFCNSIIENLKSMWSKLKIAYGKPQHGNVESINQEIENMIKSWMIDNKSTSWSKGLGFIQFMKNRTHHTGIKQSPYEGMFGQPAKIGLATSHLHRGLIENVCTEVDITNFLINSGEIVSIETITGENANDNSMKIVLEEGPNCNSEQIDVDITEEATITNNKEIVDADKKIFEYVDCQLEHIVSMEETVKDKCTICEKELKFYEEDACTLCSKKIDIFLQRKIAKRNLPH